MNVIRKIEHWGDVHQSKWLDYLRIVLGLIIFGKGVSFVSDTSVLQNMITQNNVFGFSGMLISVAIHVVAFAHLVGGVLITLGLVTRFAVVIQIPILLFAVFFVNLTPGFSTPNSELWFSVLVLFLLIMFWVVGSGPLSVDEGLKNKKGRRYA
ncbi:DoxX family membrane protein [Pedobacter psychrodurus]|uniref:DoxX family membrane protein n=1 Tax=Pedobacter psychrodurus TaxID=2530456 RepID=A0A4R0PR79_9SPHI|nr:DoxX family membrane protein [Pedobacter psychrodurus]TCD21035.1 DoxX family membrane protein [Pedobacter psychrodurus]